MFKEELVFECPFFIESVEEGIEEVDALVFVKRQTDTLNEHGHLASGAEVAHYIQSRLKERLINKSLQMEEPTLPLVTQKVFLDLKIEDPLVTRVKIVHKESGQICYYE